MAQINGTIWVFAAILIAAVITQAILFLRLALSFNKENNVLSKAEVAQAMRTGAISCIGPAFSVIVVAITLIGAVGTGATFMRVGVIGSAPFEMYLANIGASTMGSTLADVAKDPNIFIIALFSMIFGSWPYFLNTIITLKPLDNAVAKASKSTKKSFLPLLGLSSSMGLLGYFLTENATKNNESVVAIVVSAAVTFCMMLIIKKTKKNFLYDWVLGIAMLIALLVVGIMISAAA